MARPRRLQSSGHAKSTEALARKLSAFVASRGFLDNSDKPITSFDPLFILAAVASDPKFNARILRSRLKRHPKSLRTFILDSVLLSR
jgi:hypothetical protein